MSYLPAGDCFVWLCLALPIILSYIQVILRVRVIAGEWFLIFVFIQFIPFGVGGMVDNVKDQGRGVLLVHLPGPLHGVIDVLWDWASGTLWVGDFGIFGGGEGEEGEERGLGW